MKQQTFFCFHYNPWPAVLQMFCLVFPCFHSHKLLIRSNTWSINGLSHVIFNHAMEPFVRQGQSQERWKRLHFKNFLEQRFVLCKPFVFSLCWSTKALCMSSLRFALTHRKELWSCKANVGNAQSVQDLDVRSYQHCSGEEGILSEHRSQQCYSATPDELFISPQKCNCVPK